MGNINATDPDYWNVTDTPSERNPDWMKELPDDLSVSRLSIPGTHDSLARVGVLHAWCQSLSLRDQLNLGIRFFDVRVRFFEGGLHIHHEAFYQNTSFRECLDTMLDFLRNHNSEILFMRVKEEYSSTGSSFGAEVKRVIEQYPSASFWQEKDCQSNVKTPTVGQARGKIVILQNFGLDGNYIGINYNDLQISDEYWLDVNSKWGNVAGNMQGARSSDGKIYLTFSSCTGIACPRENARRMNTKLHTYVSSNPGPYGIVAIDYPGPKLVTDIINSNY